MAEPIPLPKKELSSKLVQEIAKNSNEIPEQYLHKNGFPQAIDAPDLWKDALLIDFSLLSSSSTELAKLRSALSDWGCFQVCKFKLLIELVHLRVLSHPCSANDSCAWGVMRNLQ